MNDVLVNAILGLSAAIFGYLFGSIPSGVIIGKVFFHKDPRDYGSGNSGGTNSGRVLGKKAGAAVILCDMLKVLVPFYAFWSILAFSGINESYRIFDDGLLYLWMFPVFATVGHCFPFYMGFRGGKAVANYFGMLGGTSYASLAVALVSFLGVLKGRKMVSLSSLVAGGICLLYVWIMAILDFCLPQFESSILFFNFGIGGLLYYSFEMASAFTLMYLLLVVRHLSNIRRMKERHENTIKWLK